MNTNELNEMITADMLAIQCRTCTSIISSSDMAFDIFDTEKDIAEKIYLCLPIIITPNDSLTKFICINCIEQLDICSELIFKSIEADSFLKAQAKLNKDSLEPSDNPESELLNQETSAAKTAKDGMDLDGPVICDLCGNKRFSDMETFDKHMETQHNASHPSDLGVHFTPEGNPYYICIACKEKFNSLDSYYTHRSTHPELICKSCHEFHKTVQALQRHTCPVANLDSFNFECKKCINAFFESKAELRKHFKDNHSDTVFSALEELPDRISNQADLIQCHKCFYVFTDKEMFDIHEILHAKAAACTKCQKIFRTPIALKRHMQSHEEDDDDTVCRICQQEFPTSDDMYNHLQNEHNKSAVMTLTSWVCRFCNKKFNTKLSLEVHERIHTGQRPYICKWCGLGFRSRANLSQHLPMHTGVKNHTCNVCGKGFSRKAFVKTHMRVHTGDRPYVCKTCGAKFTQVGDMRRHEKRHEDPTFEKKEKKIPSITLSKARKKNNNLIERIRKKRNQEERMPEEMAYLNIVPGDEPVEPGKVINIIQVELPNVAQKPWKLNWGKDQCL